MLQNFLKENNRNYFFAIIAIFACLFLLNQCKKIYQCACFFTIASYIIFNINYYLSKSKAIIALLVALVVNTILYMNKSYYLNGQLLNGLIMASFTSIMASIYFALIISNKISNKNNFVHSAFTFLLIAALIDGLLMSSFFAVQYNFSSLTTLIIFTKEVFFKLLFGSIMIYVPALFNRTAKDIA